MGYYDNVKDTVSSEAESSSSSGGDKSAEDRFSTLRKAAQETDTEDGGDDTPIEVLEEGLEKNRSSTPTNTSQDKNRDTGAGIEKKREVSQSSQTGKTVENAGASSNNELADKLDKIIEQNARMIEILESFGR